MNQNYQTAYAATWEAAAGIDPYTDTRWLNLFTYYSANMEHFLPMLPTAGHLERFRQTIAFEQAGALDLEWFLAGHTSRLVEHGATLAERLAKQPGIVCTMHTGAHLHIAFAMLNAGIPFAMLVSTATKLALRQKAGGRQKPGSAPLFIDAAHPGALHAIISYLRTGTTVLALIDGGSGVAPLKPSNVLTAPFLGQHIHVRRGIPYAAMRAGTPIYPMWAFRRSADAIDLYHHGPIQAGGWPGDLFVRHAVYEIYHQFAAYLLHHTPQWTIWWNLQRCIDSARYIRPPGRVWQQPVGLLVQGGKRFAFDRDRYRIHLLKNGKLPVG